MRLRNVAVMLAMLTAAPALARAQSVPNLSGTWVLQLDKSDFGMMPGPQARTDVIDHREPKLSIKRTTSAGGQENVTTLTYEINGQPFKNMVGQNEITSVLRWDGPTLVSVSGVPSPQGEVTITDRYVLSADGKTLTQTRTLSMQGQEIAQTMVLAKQ